MQLRSLKALRRLREFRSVPRRRLRRGSPRSSAASDRSDSVRPDSDDEVRLNGISSSSSTHLLSAARPLTRIPALTPPPQSHSHSAAAASQVLSSKPKACLEVYERPQLLRNRAEIRRPQPLRRALSAPLKVAFPATERQEEGCDRWAGLTNKQALQRVAPAVTVFRVGADAEGEVKVLAAEEADAWQQASSASALRTSAYHPQCILASAVNTDPAAAGAC